MAGGGRRKKIREKILFRISRMKTRRVVCM